jgi:hypothetical protein
MTVPNPVPARLFVLLAREAHIGVILRRGPSKWVQLIHWDTEKDIFTPGQWLHGRIYELRCDLSPDGKLFIYFAHKGGNWKQNPDYTDAWTAISKPPYFTALALWPKGDTWEGGGLFLKKRTVWLNHFYHKNPHPDHKPHRLKIEPNLYMPNVGEHRIYHPRLTLYGWQLIEAGSEYRRGSRYTSIVTPASMWIKESSDFRLTQYVGANPDDEYERYEYLLTDIKSGQEFDLADAIWADFDQQKRLVLAKAGKLFSAAVVDGELALTQLADFNGNQPEAIESPEWAKKW